MFNFVFLHMLQRSRWKKPRDWIFAKDHKMPGLKPIGATIRDKLFSILRKIPSE